MNRQRIRFATIAGALAVGATVIAAAPVAHAEKLSENTIKSECKAAGGTYTHNRTVSTCTYKDIKGNNFIDYFSGGHYVTTIPA